MASRAARPAAPPSSPGRACSAPGCPKSGCPAPPIGLRAEDPTIAELLKPLGYATGQFGKNHLGDRNEFLPTVHGFDEFYGNLYHLNAEEEPELPDYPKAPDFPNFAKTLRPARRDALLGDGLWTTRPSIRATAASASRRSRIPAR